MHVVNHKNFIINSGGRYLSSHTFSSHFYYWTQPLPQPPYSWGWRRDGWFLRSCSKMAVLALIHILHWLFFFFGKKFLWIIRYLVCFQTWEILRFQACPCMVCSLYLDKEEVSEMGTTCTHDIPLHQLFPTSDGVLPYTWVVLYFSKYFHTYWLIYRTFSICLYYEQQHSKGERASPPRNSDTSSDLSLANHRLLDLWHSIEPSKVCASPSPKWKYNPVLLGCDKGNERMYIRLWLQCPTACTCSPCSYCCV